MTAVVPIEQVRKDYFSHLTPEKLLRKVKPGDVALPVVSLEASQKSAKGVGLQALADYLDARMKEAHEDCRKLNGRIG
ncbi:pyocin activator PrtN family protein [Mesorhizobium sp.]|uniref:pyocin activator PrtN family protein n=1 Tax=Mesorhizobium sp. TaxID=1871066 RepID=UPI0025C193EC|nr:pyocin activator PrtN family protein [Mesorhizobium sp.]